MRCEIGTCFSGDGAGGAGPDGHAIWLVPHSRHRSRKLAPGVGNPHDANDFWQCICSLICAAGFKLQVPSPNLFERNLTAIRSLVYAKSCGLSEHRSFSWIAQRDFALYPRSAEVMVYVC